MKERISMDLLPKLSDALGGLPNIKRRNAFRLVKEAMEDLLVQNAPRKLYGRGKARSRCVVTLHGGLITGPRQQGERVTLDEIEVAFIQDVFGILRVTPEGAGLLVRLYEAGAFELKSRRSRIEEPVNMKQLASARARLEARTDELA